MQLDSVDLLERDATSLLRSGIGEEFTRLERQMQLDQMPKLSADPIVGGAAWNDFEQRRVLKLTYTGDPTEYWEIETISFSRGQGSGGGRQSLTCRPLWARLDDQVAYVTLSGGLKETELSNTNTDVSVALNRILSSEWNCPALFAPGVVDPDLSGTATFTFLSAGTHLEHLDAIAEDLSAEWYPRWDDGNSEYKIDLLERIGDPDASNRTIRERQDAQNEIVNRLSMRDERRSAQYFSTVMPLSGQESSTLTMAGARWTVASASYDSGADQTTLTFEQEPIWDDGVLVNAQLRKAGAPGATPYGVVSATAPDQVTVSGDATGLSVVSFVDLSGDDLIRLQDPSAASAFGSVTKPKRFSEVAPYENLLVRAGVVPEADSLTGWAALGSNTTLSLASGRDYARTGDQSIKVETTAADEEEGIQAAAFDFRPDEVGQVLSAHVSVRVESGRVQVQLVDKDGKEYPPDETIEGGQDRLVGYTIGGAKPPAGDVFLKVTKLETSSVFYVDNAAVVPSASPAGYAPYMGSRGLWLRGMEYLLRKGGTPEQEFDGQVIDLSVLENIGDELTLGDATTVELHSGATLEARITSTTKRLYPGEPSTEVRAKLGEPMNDALERFFDRPDGSGNGDGTGGTPRVEPVIELEGRYQDNTPDPSEGVLEFSVSDPVGVVTQVQGRKKVGANFEDGDPFSNLSSQAGTYTVRVDLVESHNSFIEVRLLTAEGVDDVQKAWEYDHDQIPNADYSVEWAYNSSRGTVEATIVAKGDEDVASYKFTLDNDQDGTAEETVTAGNSGGAGVVRSATEVLNPSVTLTPGNEIDITAEAYSETDQQGNTQPPGQQLDETFEVPRLDGTIPEFTPQLSALTLDQITENGTPKGKLDFTLDDPSDIVTQVDSRVAAGRNLDPSSDSYSQLTKTSGTYTEKVPLSESHDSFIQVALRVAGDREDVIRTFSFDRDQVPEATYTPKWLFDAANSRVLLEMAARGDEDTYSYEFELDSDQDGTAEETQTAGDSSRARTASVVLNQNTNVAPGDRIDVTGTAYSQIDQQGTSEAEPFDEELEVPELSATSTVVLPSLVNVQMDEDSNGDGRLTFEVDDPDGILSQVQEQTAEGQNLPSTDNFTRIDDTQSEPYEVTVGLVGGHNSYVEIRLTTDTGFESVRRQYVFDPDEIPEASYTLNWFYDTVASTPKLEIIASGDDDVESFKFATDFDQDGTNEFTGSVDASGTTQTMNPNTAVAAGQQIDVEATAYSKTISNRTASDAEENPLQETVEAPALRDTITPAPPQIVTEKVHTYTASGTPVGEIEFSVNDPQGQLSDVKTREAKGRNLEDTDSFSAPWDDSGPVYQERVELVDKHPSYIEIKLETSSGEPVREVFVFDADPTPEGSVQIHWTYDDSIPGMAAVAQASGDDDVKSWKFEISNAGGDSDTKNVDGQKVRQQINTSFGAAPGNEVSISATAYEQTGQSGKSNAIVESKTFTVMADIDAINEGSGPVIEGKHILLDGDVSVKGSLDLFPATGYHHPELKALVQNGAIKERVTFLAPNTVTGTELTGPLNGRRYKLRDGAQLVDSEGPHGLACYLGGSGAYLPVEFEVSQQSPDCFFAGWFKFPAGQSLASTNIIASMDASEHWRLFVGSSGILKVNDALGSNRSTGKDVVDGRWHHLQLAYLDQGSTTRTLIYIDGQVEVNQDMSSTFTSADRFLMVGTGSEATSYNGATGPDRHLEMYFSELTVGKGANWDNNKALPLYKNPSKFQPIGEVHGDLLVDGTIRADKINVSTLEAVQASTGSLNVNDTLTMDSAGEITNNASTPDFLIDDQGVNLRGDDFGFSSSSIDFWEDPSVKNNKRGTIFSSKSTLLIQGSTQDIDILTGGDEFFKLLEDQGAQMKVDELEFFDATDGGLTLRVVSDDGNAGIEFENQDDGAMYKLYVADDGDGIPTLFLGGVRV